MKNENKNYIYKTKLNIIYRFIIKILSNYLLINIFLTLFPLSNEQFELNLVVMGPEYQKLLSDYFDISSLNPVEIIVDRNVVASNVKGFDFENDYNNVTIKSNNPIYSCENMFTDLTNIIEIDLSKLDISLVESMSGMFNGCINLKKITFGNSPTSSLRTMHRLFYNCNKLTSIDLSNFDTSSVTNMVETFSHCESLLSINASHFNTQNVEEMIDLFAYCYNLTSINLSNFKTSKVTNMKGVFYQCYNLESLDLSNFDMSSVTIFESMFAYTYSLSYLNLFKINNNTSIFDLFLSTSPHMKICVEDLETLDLLKEKGNDLNY